MRWSTKAHKDFHTGVVVFALFVFIKEHARYAVIVENRFKWVSWIALLLIGQLGPQVNQFKADS